MTGQSDLRIAVIGLGHVGLPTALALSELGHTVLGGDDSRTKAGQISNGEPPFHEPGLEALLRKHLDTGRFEIQDEPSSAIRKANVVFVCVPTPQQEDGSADLSYLDNVCKTIASNINGYKLIVEKSTAPVQTAQTIKDSIARYIAARSGLSDTASEHFEVAVNPEFLREGSAVHDVLNPDRIVIGVESEKASDILLEIYRPLIDRTNTGDPTPVVVTDPNTAEIIKHSSNAMLATRISFANMVADLCEATGANVDDVVRGMSIDPRIRPHFLNAGIGYGGSCFPKDVRAFTWIGSQHEVDFSLLKEVDRINERRVEHFVSKLRRALGFIDGKTLAVWGLAFKPGVDDVRDAPSLAVVGTLLNEGANLRLFDPMAMTEFMSHYPKDTSGIIYCDSPLEAVAGSDGLLVVTEWPDFLDVDLETVRDRMAMSLIVDGRNLFEPEVVRAAGFEYLSIGRP